MPTSKKWTRPDNPQAPAISKDLWLKHFKSKKRKPLTKVESRKERLLVDALGVAEFEEDNEDAICEIVCRALDADFFHLALDAYRCFSSSSRFELFRAAERIFHPDYWPFIDEEFFLDCEFKIVRLEGWENIQRKTYLYDYKSECLGRMGAYQFCRGNSEKAYKMWEMASDKVFVNRTIASTSDSIARKSSDAIEMICVPLAMTISEPNIKAQALASLTQHI